MTAPQQVEQQQVGHDTRDAVLAALALYFASAAAISAVTLPAGLMRRMVALGITPRAARAAAKMTMQPALTGRRRYGSPSSTPGMSTSRAVAADEPKMRAAYLLNAAERLDQADRDGAFVPARRMERSYLAAHSYAGRNRARAAAELDRVAAEHGPWLVWRTQRDSRVDPECGALEGTVFTIDNLPKGQIPGAVHPRCRCRAEPLLTSFDAVPTLTTQGAS